MIRKSKESNCELKKPFLRPKIGSQNEHGKRMKPKEKPFHGPPGIT
jgi:hypothetical protein